MLTQDQVLSAVRWLVTALSGVVAGYLVSKGWATSASATALTTFLLGFVPSIATLIWGILSHSKNALIAKTSALPDVDRIVTTPEIAHSVRFGANDKVTTA